MSRAVFFNTAGDWLNPVFVREARRLVRNRVALVGYLGIMGLSFLIFLGYLLNNRQTNFLLAEAEGMAGFNFTFYTAGLCALAVAFGNMLSSTAAEREPERLDLLFLTPITAWQYVRGKLQAALLTIFIFLGGAMPFIVLWTFMPGVSLVAFWKTLGYGLAFALPLLSAYLFLAVLPVSRPVLRGLVVLLSFTSIIGLLRTALVMSWHGRRFVAMWGGSMALIWLASLGLTCVLLINASAMIMPNSANRAAFVRGSATGVIMVTFGAFMAKRYLMSPTAAGGAQTFLAIVTPFYYLIAIGIGTSTGTGRSVLNRLPWKKPQRLLCMPFCNGSVNALIWTGLAGGLIIYFSQCFGSPPALLELAGYLCYPVFCALLGVLLCRRVYRKSFPNRIRDMAYNACIITVFLLFYMFTNIGGRLAEGFFFGNPFKLIYGTDAFSTIHATVILVGTCALLRLNRAWIAEGVRQYWPPAGALRTTAGEPPKRQPAGTEPGGAPRETAG